MTDRARILRRLRVSRHSRAGTAPAIAAAAEGQEDSQDSVDWANAGPVPESEAIEEFCRQAVRGGAKVAQTAGEASLIDAIRSMISKLPAPARGCRSRHAALECLAVPFDAVAPARDRPQRDDAFSINVATAGIIETGSIVVDSGADQGAAMSFLTPVHVAILPVGRLFPTLEAFVADHEPSDAGVWTEGRAARHPSGLRTPGTQYGEMTPAPAEHNPFPRHRVLVRGPSRSADIGQTLLSGAHGPVALHILLF